MIFDLYVHMHHGLSRSAKKERRREEGDRTRSKERIGKFKRINTPFKLVVLYDES